MYVYRIAAAVVGDGFDPRTTVGPMIDQAGAAKVEHHIADAVSRGARLECGGTRVLLPEPRCGGFFIEPAVVTNVSVGMLLLREETFRPGGPAIPFHDGDETGA